MNKTKTFKIGECCVGGIIQVKISRDKTMIGIRNATWEKNETLGARSFRIGRCSNDIEIYLNDLTTFYYASKIVDWIKENTK
jgi:hypothetical protein